MSTPIRSSTVLPGRRTAITLRTADGLSLVGELALPADRPPRATLLCLHPLPTHGGMMDSQLYRKAAWRLPALADLAVLRFNTRGTASAAGRSEGEFDHGRREGLDVAAAVAWALRHELPDIWALGWSFGADLALMYGLDPAVRGAVLLSPPLRFSGPEHLQAWASWGRPLHALVPELDDYLRPAEARERLAVVPQAEVTAYPGARHLWVGRADEVLDGVVSIVAPTVPTPLPRSWDGPCESVHFAVHRG
ncbi:MULTISPECIES: alpha/beta hydrolase [Actinoalloteichus]|uniref:Hydrolase of the alpha/beta superfamily n=1 Tax=Actinoalloteichus fjordicus TaxID=1612552 RepID=A0AAC9L8U7_9PSEU|nr:MULTISPECIES: alpha/beta hydrolase [Actinoalloteichus]APU13503.1 putative hydrolase of the alpha/beta superfamily [Actinoalloteichus fjordicus]APU19452.1 putative hydrolase of the alpha/beta superfamily [Actinoalloteichus sp. GBA129-24]